MSNKGVVVEFLNHVTGPVLDAANGLIQWRRSTQACTPESQAFLYMLLASWLAISLGGIQLWRKVIRTPRQAVLH